jgi:hypothetical protein
MAVWNPNVDHGCLESGILAVWNPFGSWIMAVWNLQV